MKRLHCMYYLYIYPPWLRYSCETLSLYLSQTFFYSCFYILKRPFKGERWIKKTWWMVIWGRELMRRKVSGLTRLCPGGGHRHGRASVNLREREREREKERERLSGSLTMSKNSRGSGEREIFSRNTKASGVSLPFRERINGCFRDSLRVKESGKNTWWNSKISKDL